ncbi:hypothetical protein SDC9_196226 [bioreactor metagenome]|uniref:Uncharacterized protein n=1 Tax=bioreactor metagenome TaxID=1076179 RepID=A0A645ICH7_9ZZZZ
MVEVFCKRENEIIEWARKSYHDHWDPEEKDEGKGDKNSIKVHKAWQKECLSLPSFECEKKVAKISQKFDVFDSISSTVYELKTSGNNSDHEFYKDLFKVLVHNKNSEQKIKRFIFLTEQKGIKALRRKMPHEIKVMLEQDFSIRLVSLDSDKTGMNAE